MGKSVAFTRILVGLGLASSLFLGCEQFLGQQDKGTPAENGINADAPADVALKLTVKETDECMALRAQVLAADAAGEATVTLQTDFIRNCIEEVRSSDASKSVIIPAGLIPDERTRCRWIVSQVEGGHEEMIIKFRYYCPDDCDTLRLVDSVRHAILCRDPKPDCATLKAQLSKIDPKSEEFARLSRFLHEHCGLPDTSRPKDTVLSDCDILRKKLATLDPASADYARLKQLIAEKCMIKPPLPSPCDSLKRLLATVDSGSAEYARILAILREKCGRPDTLIIKPLPTLCDSLRRQLSLLDPASESYAKMKLYYYQRCVDTLVKPLPPNCDSLRKVLANTDTTTDAYFRLKRLIAEYCGIKVPIDTLIVKPPTYCDSLRKQLSITDPNSDAYIRLKTLYGEKCMEIKPVDPIKVIDPPMTDCEAIKLKMSLVDPASKDYAYLLSLYAEKCTVR